ncbi:Oidioi.mRNA.OKI2018_I69.PAR.g9891.t1.cds [Oikopleura dioica]|uniref:Oidioi.mRNA.OKI2018_I69.PAR.g9891.t1.cds n=1 Tax=Oikopleura dioica TaxID=34765 RepID=A0ABN7RVH3_OIKDI|nr:Oidioi.mRNA.OKI2018_I69.PAR.g9891.t1.cds [Oikopleura dioica]
MSIFKEFYVLCELKNHKKDDNNFEEGISGSASEREDDAVDAAEIEEDQNAMTVLDFGIEEMDDEDGDYHVMAVNAVHQYVGMIKFLSSDGSRMMVQGQSDSSDEENALELNIEENSFESQSDEADSSEVSEAYSEF